GEGIAEFKITVPAQPPQTFYTRFGNVFIALCVILFAFAAFWAFGNWRRKKLRLRAIFEASPEFSELVDI
ncbi:MAG: hypothetical protein PHQ27_11105, partial [Victivallales bacterium]|nr:hypothetical protein [Victivallales bacterium]